MSGAAGRYLVATRDISPLELVMTDQPCVVGPPVTPCQGCQVPLCSSSCQAGPRHKTECQVFQRMDVKMELDDLNKNHLLYSVVFPLRMLLLENNNGTDWEKINFLRGGDCSKIEETAVWSEVVFVIEKWLAGVAKSQVVNMI